MHLLIDSNQKQGQHKLKHEHFEAVGVVSYRLRLPFGDYALAPSIVVDTKADIYELANNIDVEHDRFRAECIRARDAGCRLIILVENRDNVQCLADLERWTESDAHFRMRRGKQRISGKRLARACATMHERYGVEFMFCTPEQAGPLIIELLQGGGADG